MSDLYPMRRRTQFKSVFSELPNDLIMDIIHIKTTQLKAEEDKKTEAIKNSLCPKVIYDYKGDPIDPDEVVAYNDLMHQTLNHL